MPSNACALSERGSEKFPRNFQEDQRGLFRVDSEICEKFPVKTPYTAPPHFHARYGEFEATIDIGTLEVLEGKLPQRALILTLEWGMIHKQELLSNWQRCRDKAAPAKIEPLL